MRRLLAALLTALLTAQPLAAQAWWAEGHQTVATIAAGLIKGSPAEARVTALLGDLSMPLASIWADCVKGISPKQDYSYPAPGKFPACAELETPERMAEMSDYVRRNDRQCIVGSDEDSCHKQTHYADVAPERGRYREGVVGARTDDVVGALRQAILVLQGQPAPGQPNFKNQREALLVLIHLVGDIHQPLHVSAPYLDARGRRVDPDRHAIDPARFTVGGNSLDVVMAPGQAPMNLHALWDRVPDQFRPSHVDDAWLAEARQVRPDNGSAATWPARWATQSVAQAGMVMQGLVFSPREGSHWKVSLPDGYAARMDAIKRQQLTLAGTRLAQVLKAVFPAP